MNKVSLEQHSTGNYKLTLPDGSERPDVSLEDVAKSLKYKEEEFQAAIENMRALRTKVEAELAKR